MMSRMSVQRDCDCVTQLHKAYGIVHVSMTEGGGGSTKSNLRDFIYERPLSGSFSKEILTIFFVFCLSTYDLPEHC